MWKIYKFTNKTYNEKAKCYKAYVGMTHKSIEERFEEHCLKSSGCKVFNRAIIKYGKDNWILEILEDNIKTEKDGLERESFYIQKHNTLVKNGKGYNIYLYNSRKIIDGKVKCYGECGQYKTLDCFHKNKKYELNIEKACKECMNKKKRELNKKPHVKKQKKRYRARNKLKIANTKSKRCEFLSQNNKELSLKEKYNKIPTKLCFTCEIVKSTTEFGIRNRRLDGFSGSCKDCISKYKRDNRNKKVRKNKTYPSVQYYFV